MKEKNNMKIVYVKLINFEAISKAMGLKEFTFSFDKIDKPIIQIYGKNHCGKTVLMQLLHPFSGINLNGDERSDLALIIPGEVGIKNIVYEINGEVYSITHTYKPAQNGHLISSSLIHDGVELNTSNGVTVFNSLIEKIFGINKYVFQFIINGTQLLSFAMMSSTQRKALMNKAMGIDIYDKIHKMSTDDYRYTSKLISSLNNTKEYLLSTYGSFETLVALLNHKRKEKAALQLSIDTSKSRLDSLTGTISTIKRQNVIQELTDVSNTIIAYKNVVNIIGEFDDNMYEKLIDQQISLNNEISDLRNKKIIISKDLDILYSKKRDIENTMLQNQKMANDYQDMINLKNDLSNHINELEIKEFITSSSNYLQSMMSLAQGINGICKDIVTSINEKHLTMFTDMISKGIDVSAFLIQEGSSLIDSEKEKGVITRIRNMVNSVDGDYIDDCCYPNCIYRNTKEKLDMYFKSYQSTKENTFTAYDIEQLDLAYKNIQTIKKLIHMEFADEIKELFDIKNIMNNISIGEFGIDIKRIQYLLEEAGKIEQRNRYISQLSDINKSIENMKKSMVICDSSIDNSIGNMSDQITKLQDDLKALDAKIDDAATRLSSNDQNRMMLSQIKNINIKDANKRYQKLLDLSNTLQQSENEYNILYKEYNEMCHNMVIISKELDAVENANNQYTTTVAEIEKHLSNDKKYKIIAEATSSTKGKPVIAIRNKVHEALLMTNRLLNVMYNGDIEMLEPVIDEAAFELPFRCGCNISRDIRYGSQSETSLLNFALSLSLASLLTPYNIILADEEDAYLDSEMSDSFVLMLGDIMSTLKMEQLFIISHKLEPGRHDNMVYVLNLSDEINKLSA